MFWTFGILFHSLFYYFNVVGTQLSNNPKSGDIHLSSSDEECSSYRGSVEKDKEPNNAMGYVIW